LCSNIDRLGAALDDNTVIRVSHSERATDNTVACARYAERIKTVNRAVYVGKLHRVRQIAPSPVQATYTDHAIVGLYSRLWKLLKTPQLRLSSLFYQVLQCSFRVSSHKRGSCPKQWTLLCVYSLILWNNIQSTMKQPISICHSISRQFSGLWIGSRSIRRAVLQLLFSVKSSQPFLSSYLYEVCGHWRMILLKVEQ
jgi:hypothetical protein